MKVYVFGNIPPPPVSMLFALVNRSFHGSARRYPLCNSFNNETGGGGTKIKFFHQGSNTGKRS